jgi:ribonuclease Z
MLGVTILGNNSALAMHDRHQTSQVITTDEHLFLVDCGESIQSQMHRFKIKRSRIDHVFISHLHGDHYFGLPGLLNTYSLNNRKFPLHLYATPELKELIDLQTRISSTQFSYDLIFHPIIEASILLDLPTVEVSCFPVTHRIPCWGFAFHTKGKHPKSYAFCADTKYDESFLDKIQGYDLVYHESTYLDDQEVKAAERHHCTSSQAAQIAKKANAKKLLLGHFSSKYDDLQLFETEAKKVFPNTEVSKEGVTYLA